MMLFEKVDQNRRALWEHPFAVTMRNTNLPAEARISPVPQMTFFIMGFKDILFDLQREGEIDSVQKAVNEHCQEDNGHWKWFLNDLERIQVPGNFLDDSKWNIFAELWSDNSWPIRNTVYEAIHLGRKASTSRLRLLMLEVIEAIFSVYAESINVLVKQQGKWETYEFFGKVHYDAENDHSCGSWLDGGKTTLESEEGMTEEEIAFGQELIEGMFGCFHKMFHKWHETQQYHLQRQQRSA